MKATTFTPTLAQIQSVSDNDARAALAPQKRKEFDARQLEARVLTREFARIHEQGDKFTARILRRDAERYEYMASQILWKARTKLACQWYAPEPTKDGK